MIKVKHLVLAIVPILAFMGLTMGWIETHVTFLGLVTVFAAFASLAFLVKWLTANWDKEVFKPKQ